MKPGNKASILLKSIHLCGTLLSQFKTKWVLSSILFLLQREQRSESESPVTKRWEFRKDRPSCKWERYLFPNFDPYLKCPYLIGLKILLRFPWKIIISFWDLRSLLDNSFIRENSWFFCEYCNYKTKKEKGLTIHIGKVHGAKKEVNDESFKWDMCYNVSTSESMLKVHKTSFHSWTCRYCIIMNVNNREKHMREGHTFIDTEQIMSHI